MIEAWSYKRRMDSGKTDGGAWLQVDCKVKWEKLNEAVVCVS